MNRVKKAVATVCVAATLAVGGTVTAGVANATPAEAYWSVGHHYEWNDKYKKCWKVDHRRWNMWDTVFNRYTNYTVGQVHPSYCGKKFVRLL